MTIIEFKEYFTEFTSTDDTQIQRAIDIATASTSSEVSDLAYKYLVAHFLSLNSKQFAGNSSNTRSLSSKSVDGVSLSYSESGSSDEYLNGNLNSTSYGQVYVRLTNGIGAGGFTC